MPLSKRLISNFVIEILSGFASHLTMEDNEIKELKTTLKRWEIKFYKENGRKPQRVSNYVEKLIITFYSYR